MAEFGSPLLIIDCQRVREQYRKLHKALPGVDLHYALKPLPHPAVVETIVELGGWLDLATTGETQLVTQLGIDPARCIHTHPIKRDIDIRNALHLGVKIFVADNPDEVRKFEPYRDQCRAAAARVVPLARRRVSTCRASSAAIRRTCIELARLARKLAIPVRGLSFHVGSQAADAGKHVEAIEACGKLIAAGQAREARRVRHARHRRRLSRSSTRRRSPTSAASARRSARRWPSCPRKLRVIAEPGRYISGPAAIGVSLGHGPRASAKATGGTTSTTACTARTAASCSITPSTRSSR